MKTEGKLYSRDRQHEFVCGLNLEKPRFEIALCIFLRLPHAGRGPWVADSCYTASKKKRHKLNLNDSEMMKDAETENISLLEGGSVLYSFVFTIQANVYLLNLANILIYNFRNRGRVDRRKN